MLRPPVFVPQEAMLTRRPQEDFAEARAARLMHVNVT
jgi:hypothetical protein